MKNSKNYGNTLPMIKVLPQVEFTLTGIINTLKSLGITPEYLAVIMDFVRKGGFVR